MAVTIAINGFGRIGRQLTRQLLSKPHPEITLKAVNTLEDVKTGAHLLKYDSSYGTFPFSITTATNKLIAGDHTIAWHNEPDPENLSWSNDRVDLVLECSGKNSSQWAAKHLYAGAKKVLITSAASNPDVTLCMGVNHQIYDPQNHHVISGSSCTTNCIAPVAKIIHENFGIVTSMATIIHSYTNTQNILDNVHTDIRRARSATQSLIPTSTSAVWQIPVVIPELAGKFEGLAVRVPTPLMHLSDITFILERDTSRTELTEILDDASKNSYKNILGLSSTPLVSSDFKGSTCSSIVDLENLYIKDNIVKLLVWHDNEYSYCCRVLDLVHHIVQSI